MAALAACCAVAASPAAAETLTVWSAAEGDSFLDAGRTDGIGDLILWHSDLEAEDGTAIGRNAGTCTRLDADGSHFCSIVLYHDGAGALSVQGVQLPEPAPSRYVITGGTGSYAGAVGVLEATPVEHRARFRYDIMIETPVR
ncbi:MAG: hypothetical protein RLO50_08185 [Azospirillaceae bacterium]